MEKTKDFVCEVQPFKSDKLLKMIQAKGGIRCSLKYMEYLTLSCNVQERRLHTSLGCLYVQQISSRLQKKFPLPDASAESNQFDFEQARTDTILVDLRNRLRTFLSQSNLYDNKTVEHFITPVCTFLNKEHAILKMRQGRFKECFDICISQVNDINFGLSLAKKGFEWHDKDRRIYYNLFTRLMSGSEDHKALAIKVLSNNC